MTNKIPEKEPTCPCCGSVELGAGYSYGRSRSACEDCGCVWDESKRSTMQQVEIEQLRKRVAELEVIASPLKVIGGAKND